MADKNKKNKRFMIIMGLILLIAAIAWAASELSGQANQKAQESGIHSKNMELATFDMVGPPKSSSTKKTSKKKSSRTYPPCDLKLAEELGSKIDANNSDYSNLLHKANKETQSIGKVSDATGKEVMDMAVAYRELQDQYASMWRKCDCQLKAVVATDLGNLRMKSADVAISEIDAKKLKEMQAAQEEVKVARSNYVTEAVANDELSKEDKRDIQVKVIPEIKEQSISIVTFISDIRALITNIQEQGTEMTNTKKGIGGMFSSIKNTFSEGPQLLKNVHALLTVAQSMQQNIQSLMTDAQTLVGSTLSENSSSPDDTTALSQTVSPSEEEIYHN